LSEEVKPSEEKRERWIEQSLIRLRTDSFRGELDDIMAA